MTRSSFTLVKKALNLLGYAVLVCMVFVAYGSIPNRWYHVLVVTSGSMAPTFDPGDLIIITPPPKVLEPGMVVTLQVNEEMVTHRLVEVPENGEIITRGDANPTPDDWSDASTVRVVGLYRGRIPYLGYLVRIPGEVIRIARTGAWFTDFAAVNMGIGTMGWETPTPDPILKGTSIEATKTAAGFMENGIFGVRGEVCVTNKGEVLTQGLTILDQVEYKAKKGKYEALSGASLRITPDQQLSPGETRCYPYRIEFAPVDGASYRNTAHVTITNHSGWLPGDPHCKGTELCPTGPDMKAGFDLPASLPQVPDVLDQPVVEDTSAVTLTPDLTTTPQAPSETPEGTPTVETTPEISPEASPTAGETPTEEVTPEITPESSPTADETPSAEPTPEPIPTEETPTEPPAPETPTPDASIPTDPSSTEMPEPPAPSETAASSS